MVWGKKAEAALTRSLASLNNVHPELSREIISLPPGTDGYKGLLEKSRMMELTPFEETLFLDADTVVLDRLDYGFAQARRFGLACCICECPWARRYRGLPKDDAIEYNTGVMFFNRGAQAPFRRWQELAPEIDSAIDFVLPNGQRASMPFNDQAAFAKAIAEWDCAPFILPHNWNFRPQWHRAFFGPIKIWHDYVDPPASFDELNAYYRKPDSIIQFHAPAGASR
jgi:hypothetical protein